MDQSTLKLVVGHLLDSGITKIECIWGNCDAASFKNACLFNRHVGRGHLCTLSVAHEDESHVGPDPSELISLVAPLDMAINTRKRERKRINGDFERIYRDSNCCFLRLLHSHSVV